MKIAIIGAVAAGTSAAAKARRNSEDAEIVVYERDRFISYSGCGIPYFLSGEVADLSSLTPRDPAFFWSKYRVKVKTRHEVLAIDTAGRTLSVRNAETGETSLDRWDRLILATGARAISLPLPGAEREGVFALRNVNDAIAVKRFIDDKRPTTACVVGSGFIGLEMCESLSRLGIRVTLVEKLDEVAPNLDPDMAIRVRRHLEKSGVRVCAGATVAAIEAGHVALSGGEAIPAALVLLAVGVRPETALAREAGIAIGETGAIRVDAGMETSVPGVWACGDCAEHVHLVTGKPVWRPLGSTANKTGRIAGDRATGGDLSFRGILGTGIFRAFGLSVAQTGLTEREARAAGFDPVTCHNVKPDLSEYLGGKDLAIKGVADRATGRFLGAQIVGEAGVDKRIDVFATAITFGAGAEDLFHLDLAYAPPFSTAKDPVMYTGMILDNAMRRDRPLMTGEKLDALSASGNPPSIIDVRSSRQYGAGHVVGASNAPLETLRESLGDLDRDATIVTYCNKGVTGNAAQCVLLNSGFRKVYNLSGGYSQYKETHDGQ